MAKGYIHQVLVAIDQLANALTGGWADETFSSRTYRMACDHGGKWTTLKRFIDTLFFWQKGSHCWEAYLSERDRRHLPPEFRPEALKDGMVR